LTISSEKPIDVAYQIYKETVESEQFIKLAWKVASSRRIFRAGTSPKNLDFSDIKY
jgi:hypothetical protein